MQLVLAIITLNLNLVLSFHNKFFQSGNLKCLFTNNAIDDCTSTPKSEASRALDSTNLIFKTLGILSTVTITTSVPVFAETEVKKVKKPKVYETENGIKYLEIKKGDGPYPAEGDYVVINYVGFLANGTVFDSTETKGRKPLSFRFGRKQIIPGLEEVVSTMQPGGERTCTIPPKFAYGDKGVCVENEGCLVQPNETLKYAVKLLRVAPSFN